MSKKMVEAIDDMVETIKEAKDSIKKGWKI